jgi:integrase
VRSSAKRLRTPDILTSEEFRALVAALSPRERVIVLLAGSTGLRWGELIGLRWCDIDLETRQANVTRSVWRNVEGQPKTEASRKPVPLHPVLVEELKQWRRVSLYRSDEDFVFPSIAKNGGQPISPEMILKRHIRPALKQIGVTKRIGFHSFRHGLATMLRQPSVDIKTAQELLRHANSRTRWRSINRVSAKRSERAQDRVMRMLLAANEKGAEESHPSAPWNSIESNYLSRKSCFYWIYGGDDGARTRDLCLTGRKKTVTCRK